MSIFSKMFKQNTDENPDKRRRKDELLKIAKKLSVKIIMRKPCMELLNEYDTKTREYYELYPNVEERIKYEVKFSRLQNMIEK